MKQNRIRLITTIEIILHALCWIIVTYLFIRFNAITFHYLNGDLMDLPLLFGTLINIILFYFNLFYLFPRYKAKKIIVIEYSLWIIGLVIALSIVEVTFDYLYTLVVANIEKPDLQLGEILITSIINLFFILLSVFYSIVRDWMSIELVKKKLSEENLKLELNYLKSQINPHFLFNSLNNLYSIALKNKDEETASGLTKLSSLMRFMLDKTEKKTVHIDEEIDYLRSYVELQKLRFLESDDIDIKFSVEGESSNFRVPPFLLINFVENAFKHGIDYKKYSKIDIAIKLKMNELLFIVANTNYSSSAVENDSKHGLKNVKKRLDLIYSRDYKLDICSDSQEHRVELAIKSL